MSACQYWDLSRKPQTVLCPSCGSVKKTIQIRQKSTFSSRWLVHYCGHCGLRLLTYDASRQRHFLKRDEIDVLTYPEASSKVMTAPSPFPLDNNLVEKTDFTQWKERYKSEVPSVVYWVVSDTKTCMPVGLRDESNRRNIYSIDYPDFDLDGKFKAAVCWPHTPKRDGAELLVPTVWMAENASMRVMTSSLQVAGLVQVVQSSWDVVLYFPPPHAVPASNLNIPKSSSAEQRFELEKEAHAKISHDRQQISFFVGRRISLEEGCYKSELPYFLWRSSQGYLLWTTRIVTDAPMVYVPLPTISESWEIGRYSEMLAPTRKQLRIYADLSESFVAEIVTSYVALCGQFLRKRDLDLYNMD
ncbi:hypothetical protein TCE0_017r04502 [Talaromyces pinophilus]|uniref:Uncharacterized protein n=1 Tax=Talaromyces pinophilus TaxID=128442 RepID=A0A6V8H4D8_TALPI|nr:hypothetical protein TCE0_017r04502 [Talaromyces pinophilus]